MLTLEGVERVYHEGRPVHALRAVDLHIDSGDYVSITGPSGAGKSTLLNLLGLLDVPTAGSYRIRDMETSTCSAAMRGAIRCRLFGFVFQAFHLLPGRTALENVELGMLYGGYRRGRRRRLAVDALERVGLGRRAAADPRQLSGGEKQRVAIARAVAAQPQVLFCDEPTGNLDSTNTAIVVAMLRELNANGLTVVVVTHDADVAAEARRKIQVIDGLLNESR
ncbi:ATP-binding cassette domain-containing protein [Verrucosispora sp. WMMD1129]|uniref:ABC transporter ATP-binding protein n=1 Tax=Verrucosispora sp. WMMD1129 TaxID=3016093 RepID=UPI00249CD0B8|nr:ATP-binding cassette domain-containing protein [Verrucosispora sp. WMMD1129]WFE45181.1 ATP-binding cassette domain-containing protein [Verrucosispora sp. WMMD1129]